jgi:hypothetical protein
MVMGPWLNLTVTFLLVMENMIVQGQPQTAHLDGGKTNPELDRQVALDSLLSSVEEIDLQKDSQGHVVSLALGSRNTSDQSLSLVSTLSRLQELTIRGRGWPSNQWTLDGLAQLKRLTNLSTLRIACLAVEPNMNLQFLHEVSRLDQLRSLYLVCASQKTHEYFALTNLQNLTTLFVSYDTNFGNAELSLLTNLPNLKHIDLYGDAVTSQGTNVLSQMRGLTIVTIRFRH